MIYLNHERSQVFASYSLLVMSQVSMLQFFHCFCMAIFIYFRQIKHVALCTPKCCRLQPHIILFQGYWLFTRTLLVSVFKLNYRSQIQLRGTGLIWYCQALAVHWHSPASHWSFPVYSFHTSLCINKWRRDAGRCRKVFSESFFRFQPAPLQHVRNLSLNYFWGCGFSTLLEEP